jgi:hypothetical protein
MTLLPPGNVRPIVLSDDELVSLAEITPSDIVTTKMLLHKWAKLAKLPIDILDKYLEAQRVKGPLS